MSRSLLMAAGVATALAAAPGFAQDDKEMACSMAPGLAQGLVGIEQMDQGFAMMSAEMDQMCVAAPEVAALVERFLAGTAKFSALYRHTVSELERICDQ